MVVQDVVISILRYVVLKKPKTIPVNGSDKEGTRLVEEVVAEKLFCPRKDPLFELSLGLFGERERNDGRRWNPLGKKGSDPTRYGLGLASPGACDDLEVRTPMIDDRLLCVGELEHLEHHTLAQRSSQRNPLVATT